MSVLLRECDILYKLPQQEASSMTFSSVATVPPSALPVLELIRTITEYPPRYLTQRQMTEKESLLETLTSRNKEAELLMNCLERKKHDEQTVIIIKEHPFYVACSQYLDYRFSETIHPVATWMRKHIMLHERMSRINSLISLGQSTAEIFVLTCKKGPTAETTVETQIKVAYLISITEWVLLLIKKTILNEVFTPSFITDLTSYGLFALSDKAQALVFFQVI